MDQLNDHRGSVAARGGGVLGVVIALDHIANTVALPLFPNATAAAIDHGALRPPGTKTTCNCECLRGLRSSCLQWPHRAEHNAPVSVRRHSPTAKAKKKTPNRIRHKNVY